MFGKELLTVSRSYSYFYSGTSGNSKTPLTQPPSKGCYLKVEATGTVGTVKAYGTVGGATTTETISSFDTHTVKGVTHSEANGSKKFTAITKFDITEFTSAVLYAADSSGEKIRLSSSTSFTILADTYSVNLNQTRGFTLDTAGRSIRYYKQVLYDGRQELIVGDKITIGDLEYTVESVDCPYEDVYMAFVAIYR